MPSRLLSQSNILTFEIFFFSYDQAGSVLCHQRAPVHKCASMKCGAFWYVENGNRYPSDCYEMETSLGKTRKWYHIQVPNGDYGYVTNAYCAGNVPLC